MVKRYAFSMIELIFAIVIIAVTMLSLPMMTDVTSKGSERNLESDEAIFEAYVKAVEATDRKFNDLNSTASSSVLEAGASTTKEGLKYAHNYTVSVATPASFGDVTNSADIKKVTVTILDADGNVITRLYTYKFNM